VTDIEHRLIRRFLDAPWGSPEMHSSISALTQLVDVRERMHIPPGLQPHLAPKEAAWKTSLPEEEDLRDE
jgi:hypothetical protein